MLGVKQGRRFDRQSLAVVMENKMMTRLTKIIEMRIMCYIQCLTRLAFFSCPVLVKKPPKQYKLKFHKTLFRYFRSRLRVEIASAIIKTRISLALPEKFQTFYLQTSNKHCRLEAQVVNFLLKESTEILQFLLRNVPFIQTMTTLQLWTISDALPLGRGSPPIHWLWCVLVYSAKLRLLYKPYLCQLGGRGSRVVKIDFL